MSVTYLYVDNISSDEKFGSTTTIENILYNLNTFGDWSKYFYKKLKESDIVYETFINAGRYIAYIKLSTDKEIGIMQFHDVENDTRKASEVCVDYYQQTGNYIMNEFMSQFSQMESTYLPNYNAVKLKIGIASKIK